MFCGFNALCYYALLLLLLLCDGWWGPSGDITKIQNKMKLDYFVCGGFGGCDGQFVDDSAQTMNNK